MTDHLPAVEHPNIYAAIASAQQDIGTLNTDSAVQTAKFSYKYLTLGSLLAAVMPALHKNGLTLTQATKVLPNGQMVLCTTIWSTVDKEFVEGEFPVNVQDYTNAQSVGSAISYARRYAITGILCLSVEDDDGQSASSRTTTREPAPEKLDRKSPPKPEMWEANIATTMMIEDEKERKPRLAQLGRESIQWGEPYKEILISRVNDQKFSSWLEELGNG